jgi:hypothetical protein
VTVDTTKHNHQVVFGRKVDGCQRCTELRLGMPARAWRNQRTLSEAKRLADIRSHRCAIAGCGPVCTFGDW